MRQDLDQILDEVAEELGRIAGKRLLITGGAGFLGYYLVQTALAWNDARGRAGQDRRHRRSTATSGVCRNGSGSEAENDRLALVEHDVRNDLPTQPRPFRLHHSRGRDRFADLLPPLSDSDHRRQRQRASPSVGLAKAQADHWAIRWRGCCSSPRARSMAIRRPMPFPPPRRIAGSSPARARVPATTNRSASARPSASTSRSNTTSRVEYGASVQQLRPGFQHHRSAGPSGPARNVLAGRDVILLSDGSATRTFCYVSDAVSGYLKILVGQPGGAVNIGTDRRRSACANWPIGWRRSAAELGRISGQRRV